MRDHLLYCSASCVRIAQCVSEEEKVNVISKLVPATYGFLCITVVKVVSKKHFLIHFGLPLF